MSADDNLKYFSYIFSRKQTFHANSGKSKKKFQIVICCKFYPACQVLIWRDLLTCPSSDSSHSKLADGAFS